LTKGLYIDDEGRSIVTHSMLKTMRRCPKQAQFKYVERLKPRLLGQPLKRGTWMHSLLEVHHGGGNWRTKHAQLSAKFNELFDEERDHYGDMPTEIGRVMRSYVWHYKNDPWKVHQVEFTVEAPLPDGTIYRGKVDALIENEFGLWLVDHKTHKTLPDSTFRLLDAQSALYLWAANEMGLKVQGFIWNYVRWKAPSIPELVYKDSPHPRLTHRALDTDYPTYVQAIQRYKKEYPGYKVSAKERDLAEYLQSLQYKYGEPQRSGFFRRDVLEKRPELLNKVLIENYHTALRMANYDFTQNDAVERVVERGCTFSCSYTDLCAADLLGGNVDLIRRQNYKVGDPNDYYQDRAGEDPNKEDR
jgi:hypothetical protein